MRNYTNKTNISPALAVFLLHDDYDVDERPNAISATTLLKPVRQMVLVQQNLDLAKEVDISDLVASSMGTAIHDRCEIAWNCKETREKAFKLWGLNKETSDKIKINPTELQEGDIPIYVEQRTSKEIDGFFVTGKFDLVLDGTLNDFKSTSVWTHIYDSNAENYTLQGSIYKWLNPDKIKSDYININYIFTDWSSAKARQDSQYPQSRTLTKKYPLKSIEEIEFWIKDKLSLLKANLNTPQEQLPYCTKEELWETDTQYKYYKNPSSLSRATKVFNTMEEALARQASEGGKGVIQEFKGEVKACRYCPAVNICTQAQELILEGRLLL